MAASKRTLLLDQRTIRKLVTLREAMPAVEKAFKRLGEGRVQMPAKLYIHFERYQGDFRAMPAAVDGFPGCSIKWVNVHPHNLKKGLPTVMALLILSDPRTGFPLCVMDATYATAMRTAAAGGVAAKYLARRDAKHVGIIGCGVQAKYQLLALCEVRALESVSVCGLKRLEAVRYQQEMAKVTGLRVSVAESVRGCVENADIIVTTTPSRRPLIKPEWLKKGVHINAIGADAKGKQELDYRLLQKAKIVVDAWEQAAHSGEINVPLRCGQLQRSDIYAHIGEIAAGSKKGRTRLLETTVFDSTGLAIQDTAIANLIYQKALRLKKKQFYRFI
ncbi:ornithine cyclodeaminase family protein [candidate division FCPU426 bacterium]|nr:ornithine cyclodeaminase family protein [candidate division FCPU426 bacterium]